MALDRLRNEIEEQAKAEAASIVGEGEKEANSIIGSAKRKADEIYDGIRNDALKEAEQRRKDVLISLEMEVSSMIANAKEERINHELKGFIAVIAKSMRNKQAQLIKAAAKRFSEVMPPEQCVARIGKDNAPILKQYGIEASYEKIDGVVIESRDKRVSMNATVDGTIESNTETVRRALSKGLFG